MTYTEILDLIQRNTNTQNSTTSSYPIAAKTVDVNNTLNYYMMLANQYAGNWRPVDDTNQVDYPVVFADLVSGQQDYVFTVDEQGNQILDVYKVRLLQPDGVTWKTLTPVDMSDTLTDSTTLNLTSSGTPDKFYITANGIFLVVPPNYSWRIGTEGKSGLEIYTNRTPTYFTTGDTTKKAGIPWVHHEYLALRPSYLYCLQKGLPQASDYRVQLYGQDGQGGMEGMIKKYYANRNRYEKREMKPARQDNK